MVWRRLSFVLAAATATAAALFACSSPPVPNNRLGGDLGPVPAGEEPAPNQSTPTPKPTPTPDDGTCNLQKSGLVFPTATCNTCMQASCCGPTLTCVKTDPKCAELQQCLLNCPTPDATRDAGPDGAREGGGGGGGGDGGGTGGGAQKCRDDCFVKYTDATKIAQKAYNDCILGPCGTQCK